ncbi:MAG: hypothetical protein R3F44_09385 [Candidatus Competibacteraceae bacterium]
MLFPLEINQFLKLITAEDNVPKTLKLQRVRSPVPMARLRDIQALYLKLGDEARQQVCTSRAN